MFHNIGSRGGRTRNRPSNLLVTAPSAGIQALIAQGTGGQTANIQEWQNSAGTILAAVNSVGTVLVTTRNSTAVPSIGVLGSGGGMNINTGVGIITFHPAGQDAGAVSTSGFYVGSAKFFAWGTVANVVNANGTDTQLWRDAAGVVAQRVGTSAQKYSVYNTFTDASNYERGIFDWKGTSNVLSIGTEAAGTGTVRNMQFIIGGTNKLDYGVTTATVWNFPVSVQFGQANFSILVGTGYRLHGTGYFYWAGQSNLTSPSDGVIRLANNAETDFNRLQLGGTTSSFPALKRSTTSIEAKLADDSAYTNMRSIETMIEFQAFCGAL